MNPWRAATRALVAALGAEGLDLVAPARVGWYNEPAAEEHTLDDLGRPGHLVLVVGNSRALWEPFLAALGRSPGLMEAAHPLNDHVEAVVGKTVAALCPGAVVRYAHQPPVFSVQELARVAGLVARAPVQLCAHPVHGTWLGLRAAVVLPLRGPQRRPAEAGPCGACPAPCVAPFEAAVATLRSLSRYHDTVEQPRSESYQRWVAFRDACPVGRESRYSEAQIRYHYTRDRQTLRLEVARVTKEASRPVTLPRLLDQWPHEEIPGCPGRYILRGVPAGLPPTHLVGTATPIRGHDTGAPDVVLTAPFDDGGLISYLRADGTYLHTLNTTSGFARKLDDLGIAQH